MILLAYSDEMPLGELRMSELLLVATLRAFMQSAWSEIAQDWTEGLIAADVSRAAVDGLTQLFEIIAVAPRRRLAISCMHCHHVSPDEGLFLRLISALQRNGLHEAMEILSSWVEPAAARLAIPHALSVAQELAQRGYLLPRRRAMPDTHVNTAIFQRPAYLH